ncbi:MAG TPA: hypothetical protein VFA04_28010 [Bryobacteraceae bacterium]|nr:hypothetical protein [Bryobacteraceae bacterium]
MRSVAAQEVSCLTDVLFSVRRHTWVFSFVLYLLFCAGVYAQTSDAFADFSMNSNPNGPWSYGYTATRGSTFIPYDETSTTFPYWGCAGLSGWYHNIDSGDPLLVANTSGGVATCGTTIILPAQMLLLHPGPHGENSVLRWTAPASAKISIQGAFEGADVSTTTDVSILLNSSAVLFSDYINGLGNAKSFQITLDVTAGDRIDFSVGYGSGGFYNDSTALMATIGPAIPEAPPSVGTVIMPGSGYGSSGKFQFQFSDPNGGGDIARTYVLFSATRSAANACEISWVASTGRLYLAADNAQSWLSYLVPGGSGQLQNSQCTLNAATSAATRSGNNLTITLDLSFTAAANGEKQIWAYVQDKAGELAGWTNVGNWTVSAGPEQSPSVGALTPPAPPRGMSGQFQFQFSDPNGAGDIARAWMLFSGGCEVMYISWTRQLYLVADDGATWAGPVTVGANGMVQNSRCTLNAATSAVSMSGNTVIITVDLTFTAMFDGVRQIWGYVIDFAGRRAGWTQVGQWTVGG